MQKLKIKLTVGLQNGLKFVLLSAFVFLVPFSLFGQNQPEQTTAQSSGYINQIGIDFLAGTSTTTPVFQMVNGYQFNPRFSAGVGIGYIPYNDPLALIPFYLDFNYAMKESNTAPFLFLKAGYNISVHTNDDYQLDGHRGGWMFSPGIGIDFRTDDGFQWFLNAGYNVNKARFDQEGWGGETMETDLTFKRVMFGLGFSF